MLPHDHHVHYKWHVFVIYIILCPTASDMYIWCGYIPGSVWRFCNIFPVPLNIQNKDLNMAFSVYLDLGITYMSMIIGQCLFLSSKGELIRNKDWYNRCLVWLPTKNSPPLL